MSQLTKPTEIEVNSSDPWANDVLDRREVANFISPVIASIQQPYVISIHSPYGTGKTFFVKRWRQDLENQKFKTIYFNAWETDLSNDPLVAFMSAVEREVEKWEAKKKTSQAKEKFSEWSCPELVRKTSAFISTKTLPILLCQGRRKIGPLGRRKSRPVVGRAAVGVRRAPWDQRLLTKQAGSRAHCPVRGNS